MIGDWNPRYLAYCKAHGNRTPEEMHAHDTQAWPGGCMGGYITWIHRQLHAFLQAHPEHERGGVLVTLEAHEAFTAFLNRVAETA